MFTVSNRYQIRPERILGKYSILLRILKVYLPFLDLKKRFNWLHNKHEKLWISFAKRLDALYSFNKKSFSLPLTNMKRLRGKTYLNTLTRQSEAYNYTVQMQVRQLEHEADTRFSQWQAILSGSKPSSWK